LRGLLEPIAHLEATAVMLVVEDGASRNGGLVQVPDQHLVVEGQRLASHRAKNDS
jgi:hypothetical protein